FCALTLSTRFTRLESRLPSSSPSNSSTFAFPRRMRLSGSRQFDAVYQAKTRTAAGPLLIYAKPNDVGVMRLGLSVPRRVGTAVQRNAIKRRLREAFRLSQHQWPCEPKQGYDLVINVRPHALLQVVDYQSLLHDA